MVAVGADSRRFQHASIQAIAIEPKQLEPFPALLGGNEAKPSRLAENRHGVADVSPLPWAAPAPEGYAAAMSAASTATRAASFLVVFVTLLVVAPRQASAQVRVIGPGHEQDALALFEPYHLGEEVAHGFVLWDVSINPDHVLVVLKDAQDRKTQLKLVHPDESPEDAERSQSFAVLPAGLSTADARAARSTLLKAIQRNDHGGFWIRTKAPASELVQRQGQSADMRRPILSFGNDWVPVDGVAVVLLIFVLGLLLAARLLVDSPRWMAPALAAIVVAGAIVRLELSPATFLGAWPWSRLYPNVRAVAEGEWIVGLEAYAGHPFFLTDVAMWTNYAYAVAMPLVLFAHGTYLLRDARAGLAAAFAVAFLPQHIRFSLSEDAFIASLTLTSLAFALIHGWLRDPSRVVRWLLLAALPLVLYPGYLLRPLNILFVIVYVAALLFLHPETAPRWRRVVGLVVVVTVAALATAAFLESNEGAVRDAATNPSWLLDVLWIMLNPNLLVLSDPTRTPPALIVLAVVGGVLAWRAGERRLVAFLVGWLVLFVVTHSFVVQESMQPRYHLHLVVPFLLLAACSVSRIPQRWRRWMWVPALSLVASPWLHAGFIRDVKYAEMEEYELVREARDVVPEGCTVVEYTGAPKGGDELRFSRIGAYAGTHPPRFRAIGVWPDGSTGPAWRKPPTLDALLADPPECLYLYEGLACTSHRAPDEVHSCATLRERMNAETVLATHAPPRFYDSQNRGEHPPPEGEILLRLSRASPQ